jgi:cation diffusion facilitator CzcD-associated flavoprotein CzcO
VARTLEADYLVVGAGAMGMGFTDALIDHADVRVVMVDRRHGVGGHWLGAYPFVRLHQASAFYGVGSTLLGGGLLQEHGPEAGLQERASCPEIVAYYDRVLARMRESGKVEFRRRAGSSTPGTSLPTSPRRRRHRSRSLMVHA